MYMSHQPLIIRRGKCYPGVSRLCVLGERHLPFREKVFYVVISSCFPSERS